MNRGNLRAIARSLVPGAKINTISNVRVNLLMEAGILDIALHSKCLPADKKFDIVANQDEYSLTSVIGDFLVMDKSGLWWNVGDADTPDWQEVYPRTRKRMDRRTPSWRDEDSDDPYEYFIKGDILTIKPTPDTALSDGGLLYYGQKPTAMTTDSQFPFVGTTTERTHLSVFDEVITTYLEWKLGKIVSKGKGKGGVTEKDYLRVRAERIALFNRRPDIAAHRDTKMQGKRPGLC